MNHVPSRHTPHPMLRVFSLRNFRLLFSGASVSLLGDQFALIATPWLVLNLTNDPVALGTVLALEGLPRAALMLFGGVFTDALSPRRMMLIANIVRFFLTAGMAWVVFSGAVHLWMIYAFALLFGTVAGFAIPAETSIVPMLVSVSELQAGNSLMMGVTQLTSFIGPTLAGILIGSYSGSYLGVGLAFALDAVSFIVSAITLQMIRTSAAIGSAAKQIKESVWISIRAGVRHVWGDSSLRYMFLALVVINFLLIGPIMVGIPVLAKQRLPEGATAFGLLTSAFAGGSLVGYLLSGSLPRPDAAKMRLIILLVTSGYGFVIGGLGFITHTWIDFCLLFLLGAANGYVAILSMTWIQTRAPKEMLGRMMSLLMFTSTGLYPISQAISGAVSKWSLTGLFAIPGAVMLLLTLLLVSSRGLHDFSAQLAGQVSK